MPSRKLFPALAAMSLATSLVLAGCSGGDSGGNSAPPTYANINGNWGVTAASTVFSGAKTPVGVQLTESNGSVTGIAHLVSACYAITDNVPLSGTEDYSGNLTLTSTSVNDQVLTITGNVSSGSTITAGTYTITGKGCGGGDKGTVSGGLTTPVSGTYAGNFVSQSSIGGTFPVQATLTQSSTPDTNGFDHLTGSLTFSNTPCFTTGAIATPATDSNVIGNVFSANLAAGTGVTIQTYGTVSSDGKTLTLNYTVVGGSCAKVYGTGTLTKQ